MKSYHDPKEPFYCIKLKSGETLFTEVINMDADLIIMSDPFEIRNEEKGAVYGVSWMPYTDPSHVTIPSSHAFYIGKLNRQFIEFYGTILLQSKIHEIKRDVESKMDDINDYYTMMDGVMRIDKVADEITTKFGIPNEVDTTNFREMAEKMKPVLN